MNDEDFYAPDDRKISINTYYGFDQAKPMYYPPSNQLLETDTGSFFDASSEGGEQPCALPSSPQA